MTRGHWIGATGSERCDYARNEEFVTLFERERVRLQRLALLLTVNSQSARRCLIGAFRDCISSSSVSKEWVLSWTRRMVIRNAINIVMGQGGESLVNTNDEADNMCIVFFPDDSVGAIAEAKWIVECSEFDRLVLVIRVLERYSIHDCALLLGRSLRDIIEAEQRVANWIGQISELRDV
jgi:DNA-directed RNA polymerase specialized sigma24 family protein